MGRDEMGWDGVGWGGMDRMDRMGDEDWRLGLDWIGLDWNGIDWTGWETGMGLDGVRWESNEMEWDVADGVPSDRVRWSVIRMGWVGCR